MDLFRGNGGIARRLVAAALRDPAAAPRPLRGDALLTAALIAVSVGLAFAAGSGEHLDARGWALLVAGQLPLVWRRRHTMAAMAAVMVLVGTYHGLDYVHTPPIPGSMTMIYTVAATGGLPRTLLTAATILCVEVAVSLSATSGHLLETLRISGWIAAVLVFGAFVRVYRLHVATIVERAEHAERTREEEAGRRVAEERLRIARDLHDLLAHSITLIGVRTAVASHVLTVDPGRLDRAALASALDEIAETCRTARAEVRATLDVLRAGAGDDGAADQERGPLPDLAALPGLARTAGAGLTVRTAEPARVPPAVAAAAYRIVQESLTNAVRHGGPDARAAVTVEEREAALHVTVVDDGVPPGGTRGSGHGIAGMRERARSVGGTLAAGPRERGGFEVRAVLPLPRREAIA